MPLVKKYSHVVVSYHSILEAVSRKAKLVVRPDSHGIPALFEEVEVHEPDWKDVTCDCTATLVHSSRRHGFYIRIDKDRYPILLMGIGEDGKGKVIPQEAHRPAGEFRVVKARNSTISFRIEQKV